LKIVATEIMTGRLETCAAKKKGEKRMMDLLRKTLLTGVGLAALTKEKIEALARELSERGKLSEKEGRELVDDLVQRSEQARKELRERVEGMVQNALEKADVATKKEMADLEARIRRLEERVGTGQNLQRP
jgi:polyhydroxyalkanoate synthesis regulator phasin